LGAEILRCDKGEIDGPERQQVRQRGIDLGDLAGGQHMHSFGTVIDPRSVPDGTTFSRREPSGHRAFSLDLAI
jgi:hypothetical protein